MKLAIFDLDGTLLDTLDDLTDAINAMLATVGYPMKDREEVRKIVGSGKYRLIKDCLPKNITESELERCISIYSIIYDGMGSPRTKVFAGLEMVIPELKKRGYKTAILSNKPQESTNIVYEKYLKEYGFDMVFGQSERIKCKPDPSGALYIIDKAGVLPDDVYFIGDGETDVMTALNAGVNCVGVLWGNRTETELRAVGCETFAKTPKDLLDILPE